MNICPVQKDLYIWYETIILWFEMVNEANKILKLLIENQEKRFTIRYISMIRKINYKSAYNAITKLEKEGIIIVERIGNTKSCSFNRNFSPMVYIVEDDRRQELLSNSDFKVIYNRMKQVCFPFIALIFGSYVKSENNKHSDIDILVITENSDKMKEQFSLIPLNIHLTTISYQEFIAMAKSREFSVVSEAIKKNIIFVGIEDYYRLLANAEREGGN
ncbi:MAG: nucleotidyltransferase domain-containing protein [Candidatus Woesearchaeota archaeon]